MITANVTAAATAQFLGPISNKSRGSEEAAPRISDAFRESQTVRRDPVMGIKQDGANDFLMATGAACVFGGLFLRAAGVIGPVGAAAVFGAGGMAVGIALLR